jgi:hypothetical protein
MPNMSKNIASIERSEDTKQTFFKLMRRNEGSIVGNNAKQNGIQSIGERSFGHRYFRISKKEIAVNSTTGKTHFLRPEKCYSQGRIDGQYGIHHSGKRHPS